MNVRLSGSVMRAGLVLAALVCAASSSAETVKHEYTMLTPARIDALPAEAKAQWQAYLAKSEAAMQHDHDVLAAECAKANLPKPIPAPHDSKQFGVDNHATAAWFGSEEAKKLADAVLSYQTPAGGWSKAVDYSAGPRTPGMQWTAQDNAWHYCGTLDNRSSTEQIKFIANVYAVTKREDAKAGVLRGLAWLLDAQYPNGGWPQNYPVEAGYHEAITLNDGAMMHALEVLQAVSNGEEAFQFCDEALRKRAAEAYDKGISCLIACQVNEGDKLTVWCAQHDPISLAPVAARLKEPPSLSGGESADLLRFLMRQGPMTPEVQRSVQAGVDWFQSHRITNLRKGKDDKGKTSYVTDPSSTEVYWARFYDLQTDQPIFAGGKDGVIYHTYEEMARNNPTSYDYFTPRPADVVGKEVERWHARIKKATQTK